MAGAPLDLVTITVSHYCEFARWVLEYHGRPYREIRNAPLLHVISARLAGGTSGVPVYNPGDGAIGNARDLFRYVDARAPRQDRLSNSGGPHTAESKALFDYLYDSVGPAVRRYLYASLLPHRDLAASMLKSGAPLWQRLAVSLAYPLIAAKIRKTYGIDSDAIVTSHNELLQAYDRLDTLLEDNREYLFGDSIADTDIACAALLAPTVMPAEYPDPLPAMDLLPGDMRTAVQQFRERPTGRYILRLYRESRPDPASRLKAHPKPGLLGKLGQALLRWLLAPALQRCIFRLLRRFTPVLRIGKYAFVSRYADVTDALARDETFTISQINAGRIERVNGPFILGMDRSEAYTRDDRLLERVVYRDDLDRIREHVRTHAADLIGPALASGRLDAVAVSRGVPTRLLGSFFGTPGPDEFRMRNWMRQVFREVFMNITNNATVRARAVALSAELTHWYLEEIERLRGIAAEHRDDTVLARLVTAMETTDTWLTADDVRRNLNGVVVGAIDPTSSSVINVLRYLFRHDRWLAVACKAARQEDIDTMRDLAWEILRFEPFSPFLQRYTANPNMLGNSDIPGGTTLFLLTHSAMHDPGAVTDPGSVVPGRQLNYLHFGDGLHRCFGERINEIQIPEILAALLRLPGIRRGRGRSMEGPFPDTYELRFEHRESVTL